MTFSIVARSGPETPGTEWGVAVASRFLAVGSIVPWARSGVGAVATQARANVGYGPEGLDLLATGRSAAEVVASLTTEADPSAPNRTSASSSPMKITSALRASGTSTAAADDGSDQSFRR